MSLTISKADEINAVLKQTRKLLERGWTKDVSARDSARRPVQFNSSEACSWCLTGALSRAATAYDGVLYPRIITTLQVVSGRSALPRFNDEQETVEPVLDLIDRTIKAVAVSAAIHDFFEGYPKP